MQIRTIEANEVCKLDVAAALGKIDYLVVLPEHRGKGCGTALMK